MFLISFDFLNLLGEASIDFGPPYFFLMVLLNLKREGEGERKKKH